MLLIIPLAVVWGAAWFRSNVEDFLPEDTSIIDSNALTMSLIAFLIMLPIGALTVYYDLKYKRAAGKKSGGIFSHGPCVKDGFDDIRLWPIADPVSEMNKFPQSEDQAGI